MMDRPRVGSERIESSLLRNGLAIQKGDPFTMFRAGSSRMLSRNNKQGVMLNGMKHLRGELLRTVDADYCERAVQSEEEILR